MNQDDRKNNLYWHRIAVIFIVVSAIVYPITRDFTAPIIAF
jgi:hypothetical protein